MIIRTDRLTLCPAGIAYLDSTCAYAMDLENTRFMMNLRAPEYHEFAIVLDGEHIGGVSLFREDDPNLAELGWIIHKKHWGKGIVAEAARAVMDFGVRELHIRHYYAHCDAENIASARVMEKLGMRRTGVSGGRKNRSSDEERMEYQYEIEIPAHRPMRKKDRELSRERALEILRSAHWGTLSTADADGRPYGVPVNFVLMENAIYIHCAKEGHKLDNIRQNPNVSFCAVGHAENLAAEFSTGFASAIAFGAAREVDGEEKVHALLGFIEKYSPEYMPAGTAYVHRSAAGANMIRIDIGHVSGKASNP